MIGFVVSDEKVSPIIIVTLSHHLKPKKLFVFPPKFPMCHSARTTQ